MHINCPDWIKNKTKTAINPVNNEYKYFQYITTVALNHEVIEKICIEHQKLVLLSINITGKE